MSLLHGLHARVVHPRRLRVLSAYFQACLPPGARVLDMGCGDGGLARLIVDARPDIQLVGVDVLIRPQTAVPVAQFDGTRLPFADRSMDAVMLSDVLHHADDPGALLHEASRVARDRVLVKDHLTDRLLSKPLLRFMDRVGNAHHGVALPYHYRSRREWRELFSVLGLHVVEWHERLGLYRWPASWLFDGSLHLFVQLSGSDPVCRS